MVDSSNICGLDVKTRLADIEETLEYAYLGRNQGRSTPSQRSKRIRWEDDPAAYKRKIC